MLLVGFALPDEFTNLHEALRDLFASPLRSVFNDTIPRKPVSAS